MRAAARSPWRCAINDGAAAPAMLRAPMGKSLASTCTRHGARSIPRADIGKVPAHLGKVRRQHGEVQRQLAKVKRSLGKVQRQHAKVRRQHGTVKRQHANVRRSLGKVRGQLGNVMRQHKTVPTHVANRVPHFASRPPALEIGSMHRRGGDLGCARRLQTGSGLPRLCGRRATEVAPAGGAPVRGVFDG